MSKISPESSFHGHLLLGELRLTGRHESRLEVKASYFKVMLTCRTCVTCGKLMIRQQISTLLQQAGFSSHLTLKGNIQTHL